MRLRLERRRAAPVEVHALEVVTPRTNAATMSAAQHFFAGLSMPEPYSLEIAADQHARQFVCRSGSAALEQQLRGQLTTAYPQAQVRRLEPAADPARVAPDEQVV